MNFGPKYRCAEIAISKPFRFLAWNFYNVRLRYSYQWCFDEACEQLPSPASDIVACLGAH